jgi:hypothetical protein
VGVCPEFNQEILMKAASILSSASVLAIGAFATPSFAFPGCDVAGQNVVFLAGASAPRQILTNIIPDIFNAGFVEVHDTAGGAPSSNFSAYCGTLKPGVASAGGGEAVRLIYRSKGGSGFGVFPVAQSKAIQWMDPSSAACTANGACPLTGADPTAPGGNGVGGLVPNFGISDVEPAMFVPTQNIEPIFAANTPAALGALKVVSTNQTIFGVAITNNVALPNITRMQAASILAGVYQDWSQVSAALTGPITVCRRAPGSGTQAASNQYFLSIPTPGLDVAARTASSASVVTTATTVTIDPSVGPAYVENNSTSDVRNCLTKAQAGTDHTFTTADGKAGTVLFSRLGAGNAKAIGVLSLENRGGTTGEPGSWSFRTLNGDDPTSQVAAQAGSYDFVFEQSCQRLSAGTGVIASIADGFCKSAQKETILRTAPAGVAASVLALPIAGNCVPGVAPACITSKWTRKGNSKRAGILQF